MGDVSLPYIASHAPEVYRVSSGHQKKMSIEQLEHIYRRSSNESTSMGSGDRPLFHQAGNAVQDASADPLVRRLQRLSMSRPTSLPSLASQPEPRPILTKASPISSPLGSMSAIGQPSDAPPVVARRSQTHIRPYGFEASAAKETTAALSSVPEHHVHLNIIRDRQVQHVAEERKESSTAAGEEAMHSGDENDEEEEAVVVPRARRKTEEEYVLLDSDEDDSESGEDEDSDDERTVLNTLSNQKGSSLTALKRDLKGEGAGIPGIASPAPRPGDIPLRTRRIPATVSFPDTEFSYTRAIGRDGSIAPVAGSERDDAFGERIRELARLQQRSVRKEKWAFAQWKLLTGLPHPNDSRFK
jgi:hypothetical protein